MQEGIKRGNILEACWRYSNALTLFYRWKDEAEDSTKVGFEGKSAATTENGKYSRIQQLGRTVWRKLLEIEILENVVSE